jgi:hypothetical protein
MKNYKRSEFVVAENLKTHMTDDKALKMIKEGIVQDNLKNFVRELVDMVEAKHGNKMDGELRKAWHGLIVNTVVECSHDLADEFEKQF